TGAGGAAGSLADGGGANGGDAGNAWANGGDAEGGNVNQYFGQSSQVASGDNSIAAGGDVDVRNIDTDITVGDISIGNRYATDSFNEDFSDNWEINDSFQDNSDNSDNWSVDDSFQDNSVNPDVDVDVDVDNSNVLSPGGDANELDF
ncbi:hypothetical protein DY023_10745, partial [Microbacterium bovistercoris]